MTIYYKVSCILFGVIASLTAVEQRPNIILIFSDDHAKKALSCYGNTGIKTPALDRLADGGMRFNHALVTNSFCTPSRATALTGKYSHKNGVTRLNQSFDGSQQTFPKLLQKAGYETSLFGKWHLLSQPTGFDYYCVQKMQGMPFNPRVFEPQHGWVPWSPQDRKSYMKGGRVIKGYNNDVITTEAINWIKNRENKNKPFCLLLHPKPPHAPYTPATRDEDYLKDVTIPEPANLHDDYKGRTPHAIAGKMTANRIILNPAFKSMRARIEKENPNISERELTSKMYQEYIKGYYRLVKSVDDNVGRVLDYLKESGLEKNTIVIYTSDQGFSLGEHGFYNKQWMYEEPLHAPFLVKFPGTVKAGQVHNSMTSHVDIAPTILDFAGVTIPEGMQGFSLKPILLGKKEKVRDASYYHFYDHGVRLPEMIGIRTDRYKLIFYPGMKGHYRWELFDLKNDSQEMNNLHYNPEYRDLAQDLKNQLRELTIKYDDKSGNVPQLFKMK
ncbi:N-acetylglucosamine-6-sulfatase precursor [Lentisphaera araneosa HTCC2155]|uniref:N-acetylglucosamine-6-sulfatase n=1 Tax=Lentisphaera araneosa HTCC2155 TaxID=313628 RepID=A6DG38_9BACT|nr:sulfatase [Lentisphaera araneosa]EDM29155.1 N-acetylglucosamine-6-sulfatase precursor [Lentisphaera araneosa HTCC2155]